MLNGDIVLYLINKMKQHITEKRKSIFGNNLCDVFDFGAGSLFFSFILMATFYHKYMLGGCIHGMEFPTFFNWTSPIPF